MDYITELMSPQVFAMAMIVALLAGVVKGMVGFAMPLIIISGLSTVMEPRLALAGLLFPTLLSNLWQSLRQGPAAALASVKHFKVFIIVGGIALAVSAQMVRVIPAATLFILIGGPVLVFTLIQLLGWRPSIAPQHRTRVEATAGLIAGSMGGFSGTWGPPTVLFLVALNTPKLDQIRVQGVLFGLGAIVLLLAHIGSGVLRTDTLPFALSTVPPAMAGMWVGMRLSDRIDQEAFRRATLFVLLIAALNLLRRGILG